jgi:predicted HicB family RNase H-like nuclease
MNYKGYTATVEYEPDDRVFHGRVNDIADVVTFEGTSVDELEAAFHNAVEQYVAFCEEQGRTPQRPYSGRFLVRVPPAVHRRVAEAAARAGESMNAWVQTAIELHLPNERSSSTKKKPAKGVHAA